MNRKVAAWIILSIALLFTLEIGRVFGETTPINRPNSLGVSETYQNPVTYLFGLPKDGQVLDGRFTNIRVQPYATPILFDQSTLFCGDVSSMFDGKVGPVVITYRTQAAGMYQGIGCHELISVFTVGK